MIPSMKKLTAFPLIMLLLGLSGCAGRINRVMASWQGINVNGLIASWGPPSQVFDDGAGGRVFAYVGTRSYTTPGDATTQTTSTIYGSATSYTTFNPSMTYQWQVYRMFWVSREGVIYRWAWRGL